MATLATVAAVSAIAGSGMSAYGTLAAGKEREQALLEQGRTQRESSEYQAAQLEVEANNELATSQQEMLQFRRQKKLALSSLQARSAASGFTATDPTSLAIAEDIEKHGTMQERIALYRGISKSQNLKDQAHATRYSGQSFERAKIKEGKAARKASYYGAGSTILGGISSFAGKYGKPSGKVASASSGGGFYG